jgi:ABC-type nitrate/sulfonate/bicarbonate transport system substrate-binding protein
MKRIASLLVLVSVTAVAAFSVTGCTPTTPTTTGSTETSTTTPASSETTMVVGKTAVHLDGGPVYDPATMKYAAMDGEPSQNGMFKPDQPEGIKENIYPKFDSKTFKFLAITAGGMPIAQRYYMFEKNGGTLNKALKGTGYKAATVYDSGDNKILPNFYVGYYDFAWTQTSHLPENWSGFESRQQELWKAGNNYVIIGGSYDDTAVLYAPAGITSLKQLDGKKVGIMNPTYGLEATFNEMLKRDGLATQSAGGTVGIDMSNPAPILNGLMSGEYTAAFVRGAYKKDILAAGFHELATSDSVWGTKMPQVVLVVRRDILEKHPDVVQAVVQANYDATVKAKSDNEWATKETALVLAFRSEFEIAGKVNTRPPTAEQLDAQANPAYFQSTFGYMAKVLWK